jgi:ABC-type methionine transport system ATPase subunit
LADEALSAGDAAFKMKTMQKIRDLCESEHCTVLIVSHGLEVVKALAQRCVWLDRGIVRGTLRVRCSSAAIALRLAAGAFPKKASHSAAPVSYRAAISRLAACRAKSAARRDILLACCKWPEYAKTKAAA